MIEESLFWQTGFWVFLSINVIWGFSIRHLRHFPYSPNLHIHLIKIIIQRNQDQLLYFKLWRDYQNVDWTVALSHSLCINVCSRKQPGFSQLTFDPEDLTLRFPWSLSRFDPRREIHTSSLHVSFMTHFRHLRSKYNRFRFSLVFVLCSDSKFIQKKEEIDFVNLSHIFQTKKSKLYVLCNVT